MARESSEKIALRALVEELKRELAPILSVPKQYLTEQEASQYLGLSVHSLRAWRSKLDSDGPDYLKIQSRILYDRNDLDSWVRRHKVRGRKGEPTNEQ